MRRRRRSGSARLPRRRPSTTVDHEEDFMATDDELAAAISDRLIQLIKEGATSDTVLKLAEAWAWVRSPGQPHGGLHQG
jgi:hypothetical protein